MPKYAQPTPEQAEILRRNGIDPGTVAVDGGDADWLRVLVYTTRDTICIHRGDRPWPEMTKK